MKKWIIVLLATLVLLLTGCGTEKGYTINESDNKCLLVTVALDQNYFDQIHLEICRDENEEEKIDFYGFIDGNGRINYIADVPSDTYRIVFSLEGYNTETRTVRVENEPINIQQIFPNQAETTDEVPQA